MACFAECVLASLDELDLDGRQRLLRLIVEKVGVSRCHVDIHLKVPSPTTYRPNADPAHRTPAPDRQAIWACVLLMEITGDSYRVPTHRDAIAALRHAITGMRLLPTVRSPSSARSHSASRRSISAANRMR
jgi:hypothetical protein